MTKGKSNYQDSTDGWLYAYGEADVIHFYAELIIKKCGKKQVL